MVAESHLRPVDSSRTKHIHDNIQPLAILACEKFGATLAICLETSRRVETLVVRAPQMKMVNFVKASVGFKEDSATQLCQSLAGTQFLALAASMLETMGPFQASLSLEQFRRWTTRLAYLLVQ